MRIIKKLLLYTSAILGIAIALIFFFFIGITTDVSSDDINKTDLAKCKEVVSIIERNEDLVHDYLSIGVVKKSFENNLLLYHITDSNDVNMWCEHIKPADKTRFLELINSRFCEQIMIDEPCGCIMFQIQTSRHNWSIVGNYKQLFVIYQNNSYCNCKDHPIGNENYSQFEKKLSQNWYLTKVVILKKYLRG
jgi:hypothetical protein